MIRHPFSWETFNGFPVVGILRGYPMEILDELAGAAFSGGLTTLEVTLNTPAALDQIAFLAQTWGRRMNIGAGTVVSVKQVDEALAAGASFIGAPVMMPSAIERCLQAKIPVFPGAYTPTEILQAWQMGAPMVKLFPADCAGPEYLRAVKAPLSEVRLLATGDIDRRDAAKYLAAGADGFGLGNTLFNKERALARDWRWLTEQLAGYKELFVHAGRVANPLGAVPPL